MALKDSVSLIKTLSFILRVSITVSLTTTVVEIVVVEAGGVGAPALGVLLAQEMNKAANIAKMAKRSIYG
jgi:hypothetical protein